MCSFAVAKMSNTKRKKMTHHHDIDNCMEGMPQDKCVSDKICTDEHDEKNVYIIHSAASFVLGMSPLKSDDTDDISISAAMQPSDKGQVIESENHFIKESAENDSHRHDSSSIDSRQSSNRESRSSSLHSNHSSTSSKSDIDSESDSEYESYESSSDGSQSNDSSECDSSSSSSSYEDSSSSSSAGDSSDQLEDASCKIGTIPPSVSTNNKGPDLDLITRDERIQNSTAFHRRSKSQSKGLSQTPLVHQNQVRNRHHSRRSTGIEYRKQLPQCRHPNDDNIYSICKSSSCNQSPDDNDPDHRQREHSSVDGVRKYERSSKESESTQQSRKIKPYLKSPRFSSSNHRNRNKKSKNAKKKKGFVTRHICCNKSRRSTQILMFAFALWLVAQCYYYYWWYAKEQRGGKVGNLHRHHQYHPPPKGQEEEFDKRIGPNGIYYERRFQSSIPYDREAIRKQRVEEARQALGSAAANTFEDDDVGESEEGSVEGEAEYFRSNRIDRGGKPNKVDIINQRKQKIQRKKSKDASGATGVERIKKGCSALDWHSYHFPNCNEIHEIDLRGVVRRRKLRRSSAGGDEGPRWGFIGAGLWRDVFSCDPRDETSFISNNNTDQSHIQPPAVLKMMKSEHPYDQRNFQRHRRDALVMERLRTSHHVVQIYGYCANTVLTQAISHTLDDVIYARENEEIKTWSPRGGLHTSPPLESWMGRDENGELLATRETEIGRIRLALGVFRGLKDLHEGLDLPIVHADLQAKQYLVDSTTGRVYLNDFNRCRFLTKKDHPFHHASINNMTTAAKNSTFESELESCPLHIPTAPGASRSPEEYNMDPLNEKIDIYSAGNILYGIITGLHPWNQERGKQVKSAIQNGKRPEVDESIRNGERGFVDKELVRLLDWVYEGNVNKRASASEIVEELERLLDMQLKTVEAAALLQREDSLESVLDAGHFQNSEEEALSPVPMLRRRF
ncbi:hypothetical protein ACHAXS_005698 [Conticribra weissflogii]